MLKTTLAIAVLAGFLLFSAIAAGYQLCKLATAQSSEAIIIRDDGSVEGTGKIQRSGNIYTLTGDISGNVQVHRSNIVIDGAGFTLRGNNGTGITISSEATEHPSDRDIWNVTVENLLITNFTWGIRCDFGGNHTFYGNYISNDIVTHNGTGGLSWDNLGILFWGSSGCNVTRCTVGGSPAIYMHFAVSNNFVIENNIVFGADLRISGVETFDGNYWSDYSGRYPDASEVDSSGVWDTPYALVDSQSESRRFQDDHPLVSPLSIPNFGSVLLTVQPIQKSEPFPWLPVAAVSVAVAAGVAVAAVVYVKKRGAWVWAGSRILD